MCSHLVCGTLKPVTRAVMILLTVLCSDGSFLRITTDFLVNQIKTTCNYAIYSGNWMVWFYQERELIGNTKLTAARELKSWITVLCLWCVYAGGTAVSHTYTGTQQIQCGATSLPGETQHISQHTHTHTYTHDCAGSKDKRLLCMQIMVAYNLKSCNT